MSTTNEQRKLALSQRRALDVQERFAASAAICERFIRSRCFSSARNIACYLPLYDEVDPRAIIERAWRANKRVFVPLMGPNRHMRFIELRPDTDIRQNEFGIWEPQNGAEISPRNLDVVVTPTVAFDNYCHRIGMGGGYYDRAFAFLKHRSHWLSPKLIGVAFNCQRVEKISASSWDIRLYQIITEA